MAPLTRVGVDHGDVADQEVLQVQPVRVVVLGDAAGQVEVQRGPDGVDDVRADVADEVDDPEVDDVVPHEPRCLAGVAVEVTAQRSRHLRTARRRPSPGRTHRTAPRPARRAAPSTRRRGRRRTRRSSSARASSSVLTFVELRRPIVPSLSSGFKRPQTLPAGSTRATSAAIRSDGEALLGAAPAVLAHRPRGAPGPRAGSEQVGRELVDVAPRRQQPAAPVLDDLERPAVGEGDDRHGASPSPPRTPARTAPRANGMAKTSAAAMSAGDIGPPAEEAHVRRRPRARRPARRARRRRPAVTA